MDDLTCLPHVGPENQRVMRDEGYGSYLSIAQSSPFELHQACNIGLSNTAGIINSAIDELDKKCPSCECSDISPIWGGYPGNLSETEKEENDIFCSRCHWMGVFNEKSEKTIKTI